MIGIDIYKHTLRSLSRVPHAALCLNDSLLQWGRVPRQFLCREGGWSRQSIETAEETLNESRANA
jgi:hypothetical protein